MYNSQALSEGEPFGPHGRGPEHLGAPNRLDIYGISGFVVTTLLTRLE